MEKQELNLFGNGLRKNESGWGRIHDKTARKCQPCHLAGQPASDLADPASRPADMRSVTTGESPNEHDPTKRWGVGGFIFVVLKAFGEEVVTSLCEQLIRGGVPGLHFYTLNQSKPTLRLCKNLGY